MLGPAGVTAIRRTGIPSSPDARIPFPRPCEPQLPARFTPFISLITNAPPTPLPTLRPDVSPAVAAIVERALEKDPARRYQHTKEMLEDLRKAERALET